MKTGMKRTLMGGAAAAALALVIAGAAFFPTIAQAQTAVTATTPTTNTTTAPGQPLPGRGSKTDDNAALAAALGITTEELQAAQTKAQEAAIDQMVTDGWLTQKQADAMKSNLGSAQGGWGRMGGFGHGADSSIDSNALLADALGISVDDLAAARTKVFEDQLAQAVTDGTMTQAQADLAKAERALQAYIAPKLQSAYDDAVKAAVSDGIITQEQADAIAAQGGNGLRGFGGGFGPMMGGRGMGEMPGMGNMPGMGGRDGGRGGRGPGMPNAAPGDTTTPSTTPDASNSNG